LGSHYKIRTEKTGHFFTHGTITESTRFVWVCLHGYGQLGKYFIQKFEFLDPASHYVVVPEGLNRFYFEGVSERPVASWMTREDRLDEIADYIIFLESLRRKLTWDKNPHIKIIYFGFSQGVSTLIRWLTNIHPRVDQLILWAGSLPDDILLEEHQSYFANIPASFFIGNRDPYIFGDKMTFIHSLMDRAGLKPVLNVYDGTHKVEDEILRAWVSDSH
jgi:predicted esterase